MSKPLQRKPNLSKTELPRVLSTREVYSTPWVKLMEKEVDLADGGKPQPFYALAQSDYVSMVAITPSKRILTVRQYRAAVEQYTLELPAGTVDHGENAEEACLRELAEETGHEALKVVSMGSYFPDTGRMVNMQHAYFIEVSEEPTKKPTEEGLELEYYTLPELQDMIRTGEFRHQLHISVLLLAALLNSGAMSN